MPNEHLAETIERIRAVIEPALEREGFELVDLEYRRGPRKDLLRVTLDRQGRDTYAPVRDAEGKLVDQGVSISDCARASKLLSPLLDVEEFLTRRYTFEVSSPGVNRPLKTEEHFRRAVGHRVRVKTRVPLEGESFFVAPLVDAGDEGIVVEHRGEPLTIPYRHVSKANLELDL